MSARSAALGVALLAGALGCASLPPRKVYVLNSAKDPAEVSVTSTAPVLRLERVLVPDYLDTTDILTRVGGHELRSSQTGQWGERLSLGITHALRDDLAVRLSTPVLAGTQPADQAVRRISVSIETFDVWADGHCILTANWSLLDKDKGNAVLMEQGAFTAAASGENPGDAMVIAAMANAVSQLADSIASTVKRL